MLKARCYGWASWPVRSYWSDWPWRLEPVGKYLNLTFLVCNLPAPNHVDQDGLEDKLKSLTRVTYSHYLPDLKERLAEQVEKIFSHQRDYDTEIWATARLNLVPIIFSED